MLCDYSHKIINSVDCFYKRNPVKCCPLYGINSIIEMLERFTTVIQLYCSERFLININIFAMRSSLGAQKSRKLKLLVMSVYSYLGFLSASSTCALKSSNTFFSFSVSFTPSFNIIEPGT